MARETLSGLPRVKAALERVTGTLLVAIGLSVALRSAAGAPHHSTE
jgi:hypothetical protein